VAAVVQSACSSSLLAVHLGCQSLLTGESDLVLAGGVAIGMPQGQGYIGDDGGLFSPDGHCRAFDAEAAGCLCSSGVGVVLLKRLGDALADGDPIHAVIRGSAAGNDGAARAGFTAPGVEGQLQILSEALAVAGVDPSTVGYVEAHGTGTPLGDPIEVEALNRAFGAGAGPGSCALGSVKTNIGHLDEAAGIAGLIKTVLALEHGEIPPSLNFRHPNPRIDFDAGPFFVNTELRPWPHRGVAPSRAGVSSLALGGTDVHLVLEQAPAEPPLQEEPRAEPPGHLLVLSARSETALEAATEALHSYLERHLEQSLGDGTPALADVAFTLQRGRKAFSHRRAVVCRDLPAALLALAKEGWSEGVDRSPPLTFLFPGIGDLRPGFLAELYRQEAVLRRTLDHCAEILEAELGLDLRRLLFAAGASAAPEDLRQLLSRGGEAPELGELGRTAVVQPAVFAVEYSLAQLLRSWGLEPQAMIGYSVGELVAACLAGVLPLEPALRLVAGRARLIEELPPGAMAAVPLPQERVLPRLGEELSLAAADGPHLSVVAGPVAAVEELMRKLQGEGIACLRMAAAHAFHSKMMQPAVASLEALVQQMPLAPPRIPFISNVTGDWIEDREATDPAYWADHLRCTVRFADGLDKLLDGSPRALLEAGPGHALTALVQQHPRRGGQHLALATLSRPASSFGSERERLLEAVGRLWTVGQEVRWEALHGLTEQGSPSWQDRPAPVRRRLRLPTYPFERRRHLVEPRFDLARAPAPELVAAPAEEGSRLPLERWLWAPRWRAEPALGTAADEGVAAGRWLLVGEDEGLGEVLQARLNRAGAEVLRIPAPDGTEALSGVAGRLQALRTGEAPIYVVYLPAFEAASSPDLLADYDRAQERLLAPLLRLGQILGEASPAAAVRLMVVGRGFQTVVPGEPARPAITTLVGAARVIGREVPGLEVRIADFSAEEGDGNARRGFPPDISRCAEQLVAEMLEDSADRAGDEVAFRGRQRWLCDYRPVAPPAQASQVQASPVLRQHGVYLITGGIGGIGLAHAEYLAQAVSPRLVLTAPAGFPPPEEWARRAEEAANGDPGAEELRRLLRLREQAAELVVETPRVEKPEAEDLAAVVDRCRQRFGALHGVVHAATSATDGLLALSDPGALSGVHGAHGRGAAELAAALTGPHPGSAPGDLDFVAFTSSSAALVGAFGQVDLCATCTFVAGLAEWLDSRGIPAVALEWSQFQPAEPTAGESAPPVPSAEQDRRQEARRLGITPEEAGRTFERALAVDLPRLVVSVQDLSAQMARARAVTAESMLEATGPMVGGEVQRSALSSDYRAPRSELERTLVGLLEQLFGFEGVGVEDSFFELGGHSLLAIQAVTRMREICGVDLPMTVLFDHPTVASLAGRVLKEQLAQQLPELDAGRQEEMAQLLEQVAGLSPEAVAERLGEES
jgi:acyl transferase domain-containing protein